MATRRIGLLRAITPSKCKFVRWCVVIVDYRKWENVLIHLNDAENLGRVASVGWCFAFVEIIDINVLWWSEQYSVKSTGSILGALQ